MATQVRQVMLRLTQEDFDRLTDASIASAGGHSWRIPPLAVYARDLILVALNAQGANGSSSSSSSATRSSSGVTRGNSRSSKGASSAKKAKRAKRSK